MISIFASFEDLTIKAQRLAGGRWIGMVCDTYLAKVQEFSVTDAQMGAIMFLAIDGDDVDQNNPMFKAMYEIAEEAVKDWDKACRPFP